MEFKNKKPTRKRVDSPFASNLKAALKEKNLTLRQAAKKIGVQPSVLFNWCEGGSPSDLKKVLKLSAELGVDFQWLLTGTQSSKNKVSGNLAELFQIEDEPDFSGLFLIEAKRLKKRG